MSVYVDEALIGFGRMQMSHMVADTREELDHFADLLGVPRKWIQKAGTPKEHYDICKAKRAKALRMGAIPVDGRDLVAIFRSKAERAA